MSDTLKYYADHADEFIESTLTVDMSEPYRHFEKYLVPGNTVLDLGFGSGRDSRYFLNQGYVVTAVDGSPEMCEAAKEFLPVVRCCLFSDLDYVDSFDAVWACASLLHVPKNKMQDVFQKVVRSLKDGGVFYVSYKYGTEERIKDGREFSDYTEDSFGELLKDFPELQILEMWVTDDVRPEKTEKWLNVILKKGFKIPVTETEFRLEHSKIISYYQLIESRLKGICALFLAEKQEDWFAQLEVHTNDTLWGLLKELQKIQKDQKELFFADEDFSRLHQIRKRRNYWCHECFGGETPIIFAKSGNQTERVVKKPAYAISLRDDLQEAFEVDRFLAEEFRKLNKMKGRD